MMETALREQFKQFGALEYVSVVKDKVTGTSRGFSYVKFFQFSNAAKAFKGCDPNSKPKIADPRPRWEDCRAHYGGSTETKLADLRTNPVRGRRDIEEAREVKEHSIKAGDLGIAKMKVTKHDSAYDRKPYKMVATYGTQIKGEREDNEKKTRDLQSRKKEEGKKKRSYTEVVRRSRYQEEAD